MAGNDWEHELRNKLKRLAGGLAGDDRPWLLYAANALDKQSEMFKRLILEEPEDGVARKLVEDAIKYEDAAGRGYSACVAGQGQGAGASGRRRGVGAGMAGCASSSARGVDHVFNEGLCREAQAQAWCKQLACTLTIENAHYLTPLQLLTLDSHRLDIKSILQTAVNKALAPPLAHPQVRVCVGGCSSQGRGPGGKGATGSKGRAGQYGECRLVRQGTTHLLLQLRSPPRLHHMLCLYPPCLPSLHHLAFPLPVSASPLPCGHACG